MIENLREMFIIAKSRKYPKNTLVSYNSDIKIFFDDIMKKEGCGELEAIKMVDSIFVEKFINDNKQLIKDKEYSKSSLNRKLASLTLFYDWIISMGLLDIKHNPFKGVERFNDTESEEKDSLAIEEVKKLIQCTYEKRRGDKQFEFVSARTRLIIALMTTTGMRIEEILNLQRSFIEPCDDDYIIVIPKEFSKNNKPRRVPLCGIVKKYYDEYLEIRNTIDINSDLLILSNKYKKFTTKDSRSAIKKYVERIGITDRNIGNHSFRHTFRCVLTEKNTNESLLCCIGGWSRKRLGNQSDVYLHDDERLDRVKIEVCKDIL